MSAAESLPREEERAPERRPLLDLVDRACAALAGIILFAMMSLTLVDVLGRYLINRPLGFAYEMTQLGMASLIFCALPSVTLRMEHVTAGLFEGIWRGRGVYLRNAVILAVSAGAGAFVALRLTRLAVRFGRYGDETSVLKLPIAPFAWLGVTMLWLLAAVATIVALQNLYRLVREERA